MSLSDKLTLNPSPSAKDHFYFNSSAAVVIVEYGDYECEHCQATVAILDKVLQQFNQQVDLVFRHFPYRSKHPFAQTAAEAAEAAAAQGAFWQMHHLLYQHQREFAYGLFEELAGTLKLDMDQFTQELSEHTHSQRVQADFLSGAKSGVNGTPTLFINGYRYQGLREVNSLSATIQELLEKPKS